MKSFIKYLGGKSILSNQIIPLIPEHRTYIEVFAGAAWLFFKKEPSKVEVINDINRDLVTLYRVVQLHLEEFVRYFKWSLVSRDEFGRLQIENPEALTDIHRAARFYYLLKNNYGAKVASYSFSSSADRQPGLNLLRIEEDLSAAHLRLSSTYIENLHFAKLIEKYDREESFFYLDPPYYGMENYYGKGIFSRSDFQLLKEILAGIKGKFIVSINNVPEIRNIFTEFNIKEVKTRYSVEKSSCQQITELLIMNY